METLLAQTWRLRPSGSVSLSCSSILMVRERDAEQRSAAVDISEQLCGTGPVRRYLAISTDRSTRAILQKLSVGNGSMRKKLITGALENLRIVLTNQRIFEEGIDHSGRGITQGQEGSNEDETELFGGTQVAYVFCMAYEEVSANSNVQSVLQQGYRANMRPRPLPLDVKIEIVKHSNRHHDAIKNNRALDGRRSRGVSANFSEFFVS